jgi:hypothetical protein
VHGRRGTAHARTRIRRAAPGQDRETRELLLLPSLRDADSFQRNFADSWCGTARSPPPRQSSLHPQEDDDVCAPENSRHGAGACPTPTLLRARPLPRTRVRGFFPHAEISLGHETLSSLDDRPGLTGQRFTSLSPPTALRLLAEPVRVVFDRWPHWGRCEGSSTGDTRDVAGIHVPLPWTQPRSGPVSESAPVCRDRCGLLISRKERKLGAVVGH